MGNASSTPEEDSIGEQIFQYAEKCLQINDTEKLEKITGMIVYSGASAEELRGLIARDRHELERRLRESAELIIHDDQQSNVPKNQNRSVEEGQQTRVNQTKSNTNKLRPTQDNASFPKKRDELIAHFERLYPTIDSKNIVDELLKLSDDEINDVVSSPAELKNFVTICMCSLEESEQGATSSTLDSCDSLEKLKLEHMDQISKAELRDEDVQLLIGNHLFNRVNKLHPSKAEHFTGVLMELDKDLILQLLVSAPKLHKNLAVIITEMTERGALKQGDIVVMQEELGDLIFSLLEGDLNSEKASHVTGMLLEMEVASLHEVLADENLFRRRVKDALKALEQRKKGSKTIF